LAVGRARAWYEHADEQLFRRLSRARRERPRSRTAEKSDEVAPLHSITSSARCWRNLQGLAQSGCITGRNIRVETRWTKFDPEETRKYAAELVAGQSQQGSHR